MIREFIFPLPVFSPKKIFPENIFHKVFPKRTYFRLTFFPEYFKLKLHFREDSRPFGCQSPYENLKMVKGNRMNEFFHTAIFVTMQLYSLTNELSPSYERSSTYAKETIKRFKFTG